MKNETIPQHITTRPVQDIITTTQALRKERQVTSMSIRVAGETTTTEPNLLDMSNQSSDLISAAVPLIFNIFDIFLFLLWHFGLFFFWFHIHTVPSSRLPPPLTSLLLMSFSLPAFQRLPSVRWRLAAYVRCFLQVFRPSHPLHGETWGERCFPLFTTIPFQIRFSDEEACVRCISRSEHSLAHIRDKAWWIYIPYQSNR